MRSGTSREWVGSRVDFGFGLYFGSSGKSAVCLTGVPFVSNNVEKCSIWLWFEFFSIGWKRIGFALYFASSRNRCRIMSHFVENHFLNTPRAASRPARTEIPVVPSQIAEPE